MSDCIARQRIRLGLSVSFTTWDEPHAVFGRCTLHTGFLKHHTGQGQGNWRVPVNIQDQSLGEPSKKICAKSWDLCLFLLFTNCGRRNLDKAPHLTARELFGFWLLILHLSTQPIYLQILRWQCCLAENPNNPITSLMNEKACVLSHLMDSYKAYLVLDLPPSIPESKNNPNFGHKFFSHLVLQL